MIVKPVTLSRPLKFIGPTYLPTSGIDAVTVRVGEKWRDLMAGETVTVFVCDRAHDGDCGEGCRNYGEAAVTDVWVGAWTDLPARLVAIEHEPACRDYRRLHAVLEDIYGEVTPTTTVVAIRFSFR